MGLQHPALDAAADDIEVEFELGFPGVVVAVALRAAGVGVGDHHLLDLGPGGVGLLADHRGVDRHLTPAVDLIAEIEDLGLDDAAADFLGAEIGLGQKHHADREPAAARHMAGAGDMLLEEPLRNFHVDARAVAGLAVGVDGAPVPHRLERRDSGHHHLAARLAVDGGDQADAAGVMLIGRIVHPMGREKLGVGPPFGDEFAHAAALSLARR